MCCTECDRIGVRRTRSAEYRKRVVFTVPEQKHGIVSCEQFAHFLASFPTLMRRIKRLLLHDESIQPFVVIVVNEIIQDDFALF